MTVDPGRDAPFAGLTMAAGEGVGACETVAACARPGPVVPVSAYRNAPTMKSGKVLALVSMMPTDVIGAPVAAKILEFG